MRPTVRLGKVSGIDIGLHWTIGLIAFLLVTTLTGSVLPASAPGYAQAGYLLAAFATAVMFLGSIVAHELGHSIVAQRNNVNVLGITLFGLGGVAALERDPDDAGAAARIAAAGPAVSVAVGAISLALSYAFGVLGAPALVTASLTWLGFINLALAVFNMIPALPLDGGRVLQAALWKRGGQRLPATVTAAKWGGRIGWVIVALGLIQFATTGSGLWTAFIGWFVATTAKAEGTRARMQMWQEKMQAQMAGQPGEGIANPLSILFGNRGGPHPKPQSGTQAWPPHQQSPSSASPPPPGTGTVIDVDSRPISDD